jgi:hypothetical protein
MWQRDDIHLQSWVLRRQRLVYFGVFRVVAAVVERQGYNMVVGAHFLRAADQVTTYSTIRVVKGAECRR